MAKNIYAVMNIPEFEKLIQETAEKMEASFFKIESCSHFERIVEKSVPKIVVIDLLSDEIDVERIMNRINATKRLKYVSLIGIVPDTVETNQISKFLTTRCNLVFTRTRFKRNLDHLIKRNL